MKTADLIPFILWELFESDKYGFELTKAIETKTNGKIIIKQPTLYTLLKKLEKSKFISSYWEDSEIGGKRHYYKLSKNGVLQVETLPSYNLLISSLLNEDNSIDSVQVEVETKEEAKRFSIMDELLPSAHAPMETILPTEEVFQDESLDSSTELDLNTANVEILKNEYESNEEKFATNLDVTKFTEKMPTKQPTISLKTENDEHSDSLRLNKIFEANFDVAKNEEIVPYVDYVDIKNTKEYKYSKTVTKKLLIQRLTTSLCLITLLILSSFITKHTPKSALYYTFVIGAILIALFYPAIYIFNLEKIRLRYKSEPYKPKTKIKLLIGAVLILVVIVLCIVVNLSLEKNSFKLIFDFYNYANLYAPILFALVYFLDILFNHLFLRKISV